MKKQKMKLSLNKKVISNIKMTKLLGGNAFTEHFYICPYNSEVCTDYACPSQNCPETSKDTDGHSNQCDTTNPFTVVIF